MKPFWIGIRNYRFKFIIFVLTLESTVWYLRRFSGRTPRLQRNVVFHGVPRYKRQTVTIIRHTTLLYGIECALAPVVIIFFFLCTSAASPGATGSDANETNITLKRSTSVVSERADYVTVTLCCFRTRIVSRRRRLSIVARSCFDFRCDPVRERAPRRLWPTADETRQSFPFPRSTLAFTTNNNNIIVH